MTYNDRFPQISVPIFELAENGAIKANPLFHRPIDKLHSRCVEYPYAASRIGDAKCILDVGTVKSNPAWISWLENLPIDVYATDYDLPITPFKKIKFFRSDIRTLPFHDKMFDKIVAVSVIEHIGLISPQVLNPSLPYVSEEGDLEAVKELTRVLKPGGELIMTLPFGKKENLIINEQARSYSIKSIKKFDTLMRLINLEYYEYQAKDIIDKIEKKNHMGWLKYFPIIRKKQNEIQGEIIWRKIEPSQSKALHINHIDGIICGVWGKQ